MDGRIKSGQGDSWLAGAAVVLANQSNENARLADEQRSVAEEQRSEAERQRTEAENQRTEAENQRTLAVQRQQEAEEQRQLAQELYVRRRDEQRQIYMRSLFEKGIYDELDEMLRRVLTVAVMRYGR